MNADGKNAVPQAIENVLDLFGRSIVDLKVLLPQYSHENIQQCMTASKVVFFRSLGNSIDEKWQRDSYRFWCSYFERIGKGCDGFYMSELLREQQDDTKSDWCQQLYQTVYEQGTKTLQTGAAQLIDDRDCSLSRVSHGNSE